MGNMGSNQRFDYSCLGDAVNLAARLEGQSKGYGVEIVLGEETQKDMLGGILIPHCSSLGSLPLCQGLSGHPNGNYRTQGRKSGCQRKKHLRKQ